MLPPHELKNKTFTKAMRGYNPVEVDEYIAFLIEKYTELYRENDELERKLKAAMTRIDEIKNDEDSIRSALIDAKRAANKIKTDAEDRAEAIIRSAKTSCNTILADFNEKIEIGRETYAELQRDTVALKNELFDRYSEHIRFIDKLTEGIDEENIPEVSALRRQAVDALKADIAQMYANPAASTVEASVESVEAYGEDSVEALTEYVDKEEISSDDDIFGAPIEEPQLATVREPLTSEKPGLKSSIKELNRIYRQSDDNMLSSDGMPFGDVINTPDSDLGDDESYLDFVKSVTGKASSRDDSKDADFDMLFDDGKKKKRKK